MSASEKLKALHDDIRRPDVDDMDSVHTLAAEDRLVTALPQIRAVVEAMHKTAFASINGAVDEDGRILTRAHIQMLAIDEGRRALVALDEALS